MRERLLADILVLAIVAVMVGAAELSGQSEIIFPEITAIAVGAFLAPRLAWRTDRIRVLVTVSLCAVLGVLLVRYVPLPVWGRLTLAYGLAQVVFLLSGTRFAPMISAIALPVLLALLLQAHQLSGDLLVRNVHMLESGPQAAVFEFHGDSPCLLFIEPGRTGRRAPECL